MLPVAPPATAEEFAMLRRRRAPARQANAAYDTFSDQFGPRRIDGLQPARLSNRDARQPEDRRHAQQQREDLGLRCAAVLELLGHDLRRAHVHKVPAVSAIKAPSKAPPNSLPKRAWRPSPATQPSGPIAVKSNNKRRSFGPRRPARSRATTNASDSAG